MGFAVLHLEKAKGNDNSMSAHIERTFHPSNVDASRSYLNRELIHFPEGVRNRTQAIKYRLETAGIKRKIGTNQVRAIRVLLTGSHDSMHLIEENSLMENWCNDNLDWLCATFGKDNVVSAVLHMDESTPHIHATIIPIVTGKRRKEKSNINGTKKKDKNTIRLCADDVMSRSKLKSYQDSYASMVSKYGLERGVEGSIAKHISTSQYYKFLVNQFDGLECGIKELHSEKADMDKKLTKAKSELHIQELKNVATDATIAITSTVASIFGEGKLKQLEKDNERLREDLENNRTVISGLENNIHVLHEEYREKLEEKKKENRRLESIIAKAYRWFPQFPELLQLERDSVHMGITSQEFSEMVKGKIISFSGKLFSQWHRRWVDVVQQNISLGKENNKWGLYINDQHLYQWMSNVIEKIKLKDMIEKQRRKYCVKR